MKLDMKTWSPFIIEEFFDIHPTKAYTGLSNKDLDDGGTTPFVVNSATNNGVGGFSTLPPTEKGNMITFSDTTEGNTFFYQPHDFIGFPHVQGMYAKNHEWTRNQLLFLVTVLTFTCTGRYTYGRKMTRVNIARTEILLPLDSNGKPDWQWMDDYIDSLHSKPLMTKNSLKHELFNTSHWKCFLLGDLFDVVYGVNLELVNCVETDRTDPEAIPFVSRTESDNGVSAYVKPIPGINPQPKDTITVAGGGSVLSTFLQPRPFYSGRDLYLLYPKDSIPVKAKLFVMTVIKANKYRYNYGRQANVTLPMLELRLPSTPEGKPDWQWMENYIKALPYGDKL